MKRVMYPLFCTVMVSMLAITPAVVTQEIAASLRTKMDIWIPEPSVSSLMATVGTTETTQPVAVWAFGDAKADASGTVRGLSLRDARKMGLTVVNITKTVKKLKSEGQINSDSTDSEVAALVAQEIFNENKAAWGDPKAVNWDSILALIESLLPIIMLLLGL